MMMRTLLAGIFALATSAALAQTGTPASGTSDAAAPAAGAGKPANICQELVAFMKAPPEKKAAPAKPAAAAKPAEPPAQASDQKGTTALAGTTRADDGATAKPENTANSSQTVTGQKGVATDAPEPSNHNAAAGSVANAPQKESRSAPLPPADVASTPKESVITIEKAESLIATNDIAQCQSIARQMRVAGVAMPPPLMALAALDLKYQAGETGSQEPIAQPLP